MIFFKLGFRNLMRNKKRTTLSGLAVGLGLAAIIITDGFWLGMMDNMIKSVINTYIGHGQIHHPKFSETYESNYILSDFKSITKKLDAMPEVMAYSQRTLSIGMLSSSNDSMNVQVLGVNADQESEVSKFKDRMLSGKYLSTKNDILIGDRLRKKLNVELGDRLVLTVSDAVTGDVKQELFRLSGVFGIGSKEMDQGMVIVHEQKLQELLNVSAPHEIVIVFKETHERNDSLLGQLKNDSNLVESWKDLAPQIVGVIEMSKYSIGILGVIMYSLVALGILNTLFMSLFERNYEFGVIQAIGTKKREVVWMVLSEAFSLGVISVIFGLIISGAIGWYMMTYGIDYSGIEFGEMTFTEKIYFIPHIKQITLYPLITLIFTLIISLYPAWHVIRQKPAESLHRSL
jgi:ABC-type lipoprotein release transport system permease subunit